MSVKPAALALVACCALAIPARGQDRLALPMPGDGRLDASFAKVLFQNAQAEASANKTDPKAKLLIGTMNLVRTKALGCNDRSCYFTAEKAVDALASIHRKIAGWLVMDAQGRSAMHRIVEALRGSASAETVPELKARMQKALDSIGAER